MSKMVVVTDGLFQLIIFLSVIVGLSDITATLEARGEESGFVLLVFVVTRVLARWQETGAV